MLETIDPKMTPQFVIVHHSLTRDSGTVSWGAIRRYHTNVNGWQDIGYHAGVELTKAGGVESFETLVGRPWDMNGAHCKHDGMNQKALGVCLVGDFDGTTVPAGQIDRAVDLVAMWCRMHQIPVDNVHGHRDHHPQKTCPGDLFDMPDFRDRVARRVPESLR